MNNQPQKKNSESDDEIDLLKHGSWKREDINDTRGMMPSKCEPVISTNVIDTNAGSAWNSAGTW